MNRRTFNSCIQSSDFRGLFITEMGWNSFRGQAEIQPIVANDKEYSFRTIAERNGFQILECITDELPVSSIYKKIDTKLRRYANDYIAIYQERGTTHHLWVVPVKSMEKRDLVSVEYATAEQADFLFSKVDELTFDLDEITSIVDVKGRVQKAFAVNAEKITKDFYSGFKKEHSDFAKFISGIDDEIDVKDNKNKQWYASVMLNRLMFCYFIQKKGFLDLDFDYLRHKLEWTQKERGENHFYNSFYKSFLSVLFHDGLNAPDHDANFEATYGRIPYLNGGMFDVHQIEMDYKDLDIADEAFEHLFDFFDRWRWHLDTRITASGKDINPDVLGYIFEQYINDRAQMGAYYTKEDITEYIGKNCIIPFIFDKLSTGASDLLSSDGHVWSLLKDSGDKYVYDAMKKGYSSDWKSRIPDYIARGLDTSADNLLERRDRWNEPSFPEFALPTEIWRETIDRFKRVDDVLAKISSGEIHQINDFITYNLDIRSFAYDIIDQCGNPSFIKAFYHIIQNITVLDPTCGSGAFLFAALNILEPLYEICISKMEDYNRQDATLFASELNEISNKYRSNVQYFIYKSIILRNLYGVDIMVEATEIAKLRLFLKMVAVVEVDKFADNLGLDPLPDVDFNIRSGNTLIGYATEEELNNDLEYANDFLQQLANQELKDKLTATMADVADTYEIFRLEQLDKDIDMATYKQAKANLSANLFELNDLLNHHLHASTSQLDYDAWLESHKPFNWLAEFYQIMHGNGGFDVITGNPPYVVYTKKDRNTGKAVSDIYSLHNYSTMDSNNLYCFTIERSLRLLNEYRRIGMIVPLSLSSAKNMEGTRELLLSNGSLYVSSYEIRPAKLFDGADGADQRLNIFISGPSRGPMTFTTKVLRWNSEHRQYLFSQIQYVESVSKGRIWRFSNPLEKSIYQKIMHNQPIRRYISMRSSNPKLHYRSAGLRYWILFLRDGFNTESASNKYKSITSECIADYLMAALNSDIYWWYYSTNYDMFNLTDSNIFDFPLDFDESNNVGRYAKTLELDMDSHKTTSIVTKRDGTTNQSFAYQKKYSKPIIDKINIEMGCHYGFTDEEVDFINSYCIKYRMGDELNEE